MTEEEQMLTSILNCRRVDLFVDRKPLTDEQETEYSLMRRRRGQGEPLQYILGHCEFMGLKLKVDPRVLIPRPETEILVDEALKRLAGFHYRRNVKILDIGTGSGNIAVALARFFDNCEITAIDKSAEAVALAEENAKAHLCREKIVFYHQGMIDFYCNKIAKRERYDMIISNPPYIKSVDIDSLPIDVQKEPRIALDGGLDGLDFYKFIIEQSRLLLNSNGIVILECGDHQAKVIKKMFDLFPQYQFSEIILDYVKIERIIISRFFQGVNQNPIKREASWKN